MIYRLLVSYKSIVINFIVVSLLLIIYSHDKSFAHSEVYTGEEIETSVKRFRSNLSFYLLNKMTGKSLLVDLKVNTIAKFGNMYFRVKQCWFSDDFIPEESKALIDIWEDNVEEKIPVFYGWMFSNEPAVSLVKHSIYDVMVLRCY